MDQIEDLRPFLLKRSLQALQEFCFKPSEDEACVIVSAKAYVNFAPVSLESAVVWITLDVDGVIHRIRGQLKAIESEHARGIWYPYKFLPEHNASLSLFRWESLWSNVKEIRLETSQGTYWYNNLFFRQ